LKILKQELSTRREELQTVEKVDAAPRERSDRAVRAAESFADRLQARVNALGDRTGSEDFLRTLGVDLEAFNQKFDELEQQFANQEITQSQFYERARQLADEYKGAIGGVIDQMEELGLVSSTEADAIREGMEESRTRVDDLKRSLRQAVSAAEDTGDISTSTATEVVTALKKVDNSVLEGVTSVEGLIQRLVEMGEVSQDAADETQEGMEDSEEAVENLGQALQDSARLVRGIGDLASNFGDLSDEAEEAIDSTASVLDNVGRLVELKNNAGGFGALFSSASGAFSGIGAIGGAVAGLASLISTSFGADDKRQKKMEELRKKIDENVQALRENTEAVLEQARVGEDISRRTLDRANELISQIVSSEFGEMSGPKQERLLMRLENLAPMFEGVPDLLSNVEDYFVEEQPVSTAGEDIVDDAFMRQLAREFVLTDATAQDIVDRLYENINVATSQGIGADELRERFGDDFLGIQERLAEIEEQFAQFSDTFSGVIEELNFRRQELGASFEQLRSVLSDRMGDLGFGGTLDEILQQRIKDASRSELEDLRLKLAESLAGDRDLSFLYHRLEGVNVSDLLGDVTPSQFEDFLDQLGTISDVSQDESETDFSTSATVQRTITEHQANQLLSYQQELVQLGRSQLDELENALPFSLPPESSSSDGGDPPPQAEAEVQSLSPDVFSDLSALMSALQSNQSAEVDGSQAILAETIEMDLEVYAEETPEEVARKLDQAIRNHLRRRSQ